MSMRLQNPLRVYVVVEILLALAAVYFHDIFVVAEEWAVGFVLPRLETSAELFKWTLATLLILPQSILLGATFPLMSAGLARLWPDKKGSIVSMLYFSNSLERPAACWLAGLFWCRLSGCRVPVSPPDLLFFRLPQPFGYWGIYLTISPPRCRLHARSKRRYHQPAAVIAHGGRYGAASFIYEIVWIRMLSLLLGSSLIRLKLCFRCLFWAWHRRFIDKKTRQHRRRPDDAFGQVQLVMGALALTSLIVYPYLFEALEFILKKIPRDNTATILFAQRFFAVVVFDVADNNLRGMTLPLLTSD